VTPAERVPKPTLESRADIDADLDQLRTGLPQALADGDRIEIR